MEDFLVSLSMIIVIASAITFVVGFFMLFFESKRKLALKMLLFSTIAFVVGFSTCVATFKLKL